MNIYLVFENRAMLNGSIVIKAFSTKIKANKFAKRKAKRQKNRPKHDTWGLCEGIEYLVAKIKVN